jgi:uncharacterized membrane-anchored protein YhcB (DUF1043 family)
LGLMGNLMLDEVGLAVIVVITIGSILLRLYVPHHRMGVEEHMKNGKITEDEARRQVKFLETCANVLTLIGVALLVLVLFDMAK